MDSARRAGQLLGELEQLARRDRSAPTLPLRRRFEFGCDGGVRAVCREGQMAHALLTVEDDLAQPTMDPVPVLARGVGIDDGAVDRVRETNVIAVRQHEPGFLGLIEVRLDRRDSRGGLQNPVVGLDAAAT